MAKKILKTLTNNLGFKILAVGLAFILWLVVYNIDDPKKTETYTTNVTLENLSVITELNKCYEVLDGTNTVTFAVTAKRSILKNIEDSDFKAVADLRRMILDEDGKTAVVPIDISSSRSNSALSYPSKKYLKIALEDLMSKKLMVTANTSGKVADGYALGDVSVTNPTVLKISGPASIVSNIASAVATIDVDGMSVNLSDNVIPVLYDVEGKEVDVTRLTISNSTVTIAAKIFLVKELALSFSTVGTPGGDFSVVGITSDPAVVSVKGTATTLNPLTSLSIPSNVLDVSGARDDITTTIDITEFLPDGVELVNNADAKVSVKVRIEPYKTRHYPVSTDSLEVIGLGDGYELSFRDASIYVTVSALQSNLNLLDGSLMKGRIDVSGLEEGTHQVVVAFDFDEDNYAYQPVTVEVKIAVPGSTDDEDNTEEDSESTDNSEDGGDTTIPETDESDN